MSKVKSRGWLEWAGPEDLRSPARGAMEPPRSPAVEWGMEVEDVLSSAGRGKNNREHQTVSGFNKQTASAAELFWCLFWLVCTGGVQADPVLPLSLSLLLLSMAFR